MRASRPAPKFVSLDTIEPSLVKWLWRPHIPLGHITNFEGDPERGKSLVATHLAAVVSTGGSMPDGSRLGKARDVIIVSAEDDLSDTIVPRLIAAGADRSRILSHVLERDEKTGLVYPLEIPRDLAAIERVAKQHDVALVVVDPIAAFLGGGIDAHKDSSARLALTQVADFAHRSGCAVVLIRHLNKNVGQRAAYRGSGSTAFTAAARSAVLFERHPEHEGTFVMARVKNNLAPRGLHPTYRIEPNESDQPIVRWGDSVAIDVDHLLARNDDRSAAPERDAAQQFLKQSLSEGPRLVDDVVRAARASGFSQATLKRARAGLVTAERVYEDGRIVAWKWRLNDGLPENRVVHFDLTRRRNFAWIEQ
jgi:hypothetical protein